MKDNRRDEKLLLDYVSDINSDGVLPRWIFCPSKHLGEYCKEKEREREPTIGILINVH